MNKIRYRLKRKFAWFPTKVMYNNEIHFVIFKDYFAIVFHTESRKKWKETFQHHYFLNKEDAEKELKNFRNIIQS